MPKIFYVGIIITVTSFTYFITTYLLYRNNKKLQVSKEIVQNIFQNEIPKEKINIQKEIPKVEEKKPSSKNKIIVISIIIIFFIAVIGFFLCYFFFWKKKKTKDEKAVELKENKGNIFQESFLKNINENEKKDNKIINKKDAAKKFYEDFKKIMMEKFKKGGLPMFRITKNEDPFTELNFVPGTEDTTKYSDNNSDNNKEIFLEFNDLKGCRVDDDFFFIACMGLINEKLFLKTLFGEKLEEKIKNDEDFQKKIKEIERERKDEENLILVINNENKAIYDSLICFEGYKHNKRLENKIKEKEKKRKKIEEIKKFFDIKEDDYYTFNQNFYNYVEKIKKEDLTKDFFYAYKEENGEEYFFKTAVLEFRVLKIFFQIAKKCEYKEVYSTLYEHFLNYLLTDFIKLIFFLTSIE